MQCKHHPKDYIGKLKLPSVCELLIIKQQYILHKNFNQLVSAHISEHKLTKLWNWYNFKGIYRQEEHPGPNFNDVKLKNVEIDLQIIKIM